MVIKVVNNMMTLPFEDEVIYEGCFEMSFGEVFTIFDRTKESMETINVSFVMRAAK